MTTALMRNATSLIVRGALPKVSAGPEMTPDPQYSFRKLVKLYQQGNSAHRLTSVCICVHLRASGKTVCKTSTQADSQLNKN